MGTFIVIVQLILALSILVVLHELGHFIPAKLFKTRVEKFYLFFNPWFSLFKFKKGDTEYGVGWLPLGGYVKISGMIDESMDTDQMKGDPKPWEFRSKPAWQRLIIMIGGVTVNVMLAFFLYGMVAYTWGKDYVKNEDYKYGITIMADELNSPEFFQNGDKILEIDGEKIEDFNDINQKTLINQSKNFKIERNGEIKKIIISDQAIDYMLKNEGPVFTPRVPTQIDSINPNSIASKIGLKRNDKILSINNKKTTFFFDFRKELKLLKENQIDTFRLEINRDDKDLILTGVFDSTYQLGFYNNFDFKTIFNITHVDYSLAQSIPEGFKLGYNSLSNYVKQFGLIFTKKEAVKKVGGFGTVAKLFGKKWNWRRFWSQTAFLSIALAFVNILPIPALDGGHVMFILYEMVAGRPPSEKFLERAQLIGLAIILSLFLLSNGNDAFRWFTGK